MNLRTLRAFVEVVRQGGFSQAAEVVALTQSTVSKAVKTLEDELGMPLLNRLGHKNELTAAGEIAYRRALVMLAERTDLMAEINDLRGLKRGAHRSAAGGVRRAVRGHVCHLPQPLPGHRHRTDRIRQ